jgi:hypothetical protein
MKNISYYVFNAITKIIKGFNYLCIEKYNINYVYIKSKEGILWQLIYKKGKK